VVTCSALRRSYRDILLGGRPQARMIFLTPDREVLARRLTARHGHFFPGQLLASQLDTVQRPGPDERVISIVPGDEPAQTVASIIGILWSGDQARTGADAYDVAGGDHEADT
jgi:carbohydrate kinase (thermoresistant glucokinase family)